MFAGMHDIPALFTYILCACMYDMLYTGRATKNSVPRDDAKD